MKLLLIAGILACAAMSAQAQALEQAEQTAQVTTMTKASDGSYLVNTTAIGAEVRGFKGPVPLLITIKKDKVQKVEALSNRETPRYMQRAAAILDKWNGLTVKKAKDLQVDGVTGATFTSNAIKENLRLGLEYYKNNK